MIQFKFSYRKFFIQGVTLANNFWSTGIYTGLVKIMSTLMDYFSPADRSTPWVTD